MTGVINGKVKGGFTVDLADIRAFLPGSLVDVRPVRDTSYLEGKPLEFKVIKLDQRRNNVVVSRRAVVEEENSAEREALLESLHEGAMVKGVVKNLTDYGAFVDLGSIDGLLHITDMAWKRVKHPTEIVNVSDEIEVKVLKFDRERNRVSLGLKQMGADPWVDIARRYPENTRLFGKVTNIAEYGCFAEIEEGVEGLVHVSEMDWTNKNVHPSRVVQLGDEIEETLRSRLADLHPSDIADLIESVDTREERLSVLAELPLDLASEALAEVEEGEIRAELLSALLPDRAAQLLQRMPDDDATDLIAELEAAERSRILATLPSREAGDLRHLLSYGEETAGGLMTTALVSLQSTRTTEEAIEEIRHRGREVEDFYTVFVVDAEDRLLGIVPLDDLILADPSTPVVELVEPIVASVTPDTDQEEVGRLLAKYNVVSIPVVNDHNQLLGRITFDDVIDVMEAEQTEDILRLAGTSEDEELRGGWRGAVRLRLPWLLVNLIMSVIPAAVVYYFRDMIEGAVILAAIMPVIAAMGGNAGTQALAVTIRRIATSDDPLSGGSTVIRKEILVAVTNGVILGAVLGLVVALIGQFLDGNPRLGLVVLLAMWGNIVVAGFTGAFIPTVLNRLGVDPAIASSVFVATLTDLWGFVLLLGLASVLILP